MMSTVRTVPLSYFVYSSLSFFGRQTGGELPGTWFVRALSELGRDVAVVRQTLYRMERDGELEARKIGRVKFYRETGYSHAEIDAGLSRIFSPPPGEWDGQWTIVRLSLPAASQRVSRERAVALLAVLGFGLVGDDVYIHPRDTGEELIDALTASARPHVIVIRGVLANGAATPAMVATWRVPELARRYRRALARLRELERGIAKGVSDRDAFRYRFAVVFDFLGVAWDDPQLPLEVLPADWQGDAARELAARLYTRLVGPATRHAQQILHATSPLEPSRS